MGKNKKSKKNLQDEIKLLKQHGIGSNITKVLLAIITYGAFVAIMYFLNDSLKVLAGKATIADIKVDVWNDVLASVFGGGGVLYGFGQNKLRRNNTERLTKRIIKLEKIIDSGRTSSGLTNTGETSPEDL